MLHHTYNRKIDKMLFYTPANMFFFLLVLSHICMSQDLPAKTQNLLFADAVTPTAVALKTMDEQNPKTILAEGSSPLNNNLPSPEGNLQNGLVDNVLIISILIIQITIVVIYFFHRKNVAKRQRLAMKSQTVLKFQIALAERYIEREKTKQKELEQQLELINKQLTSYTFNYQQKNKIIGQLQEIVEKLEKATSSTEKSTLMNDVKKLTKENLIIDKNWEHFRNFFEEAQFGFNAKLLSKHPKLKPNDLKLCALIRLNLNIKETAEILGISPGSVKTSRYRLRKKLSLRPKDEIIDYLASLETEDFINAPIEPSRSKSETSEQNPTGHSPIS